MSLTHQPLAATVNPSEVQQMVMNLCTNAWHALPAEGGSIAVELRSAELENPAQADVGQLAPGMYAEIVVSDDEVVRLMVGQVLERTGFSVSSFSDPLQLLEALRTDSRRYDLLVTDYSMPGLNGLQLVREIRHLCPDLPIIIVSGHVADDVTETVAGLRNVEIVNKERTFEDLGPRAVRALQERKSA